jgi:hypothetical protein
MRRFFLVLAMIGCAACGSSGDGSSSTTDSGEHGETSIGPDARTDAGSDTATTGDDTLAPPDSTSDSTSTIDTASDAPPDGLIGDDFLSAFAHAFCDGYDTCCTSAGKTEDHDACVSAIEHDFASFVTEAKSRGAVVDASKLPACLSAIAAADAACTDGHWDGEAHFWPIDLACTQAVVGPAAVGESCTSAFDCKPTPGSYTTCESWSKDGKSGVECQQQIPVDVGAACDGDPTGVPVVHVCDPTKDLKCDIATSKCIAMPKSGEACLTSSFPSCTATARCLPSGVCGDRIAIGGDCSTAKSDCVVGARCDTGSGKCVALLELGATCSTNDECASAKCAGTCQPADTLFAYGAAASCK